MRDVDVLILGAGAAGLACRQELRGRRSAVCIEAAGEHGGLLRMFDHGDFSFDSTVHALPSQEVLAGTFLGSLVGDELHHFPRRNLVWQRGRVIDYPYQFHAHALPAALRAECLEGFAARTSRTVEAEAPSFEDWILEHFGAGFYRHFFEPFNRKLYGVSPSRLEAAPMTWTIPVDNGEAVLRGARAPAHEEPGVACTYPRGRRGIGTISDRLAERGEGEIVYRQRVVRIDPSARSVWTAEGLAFRYEALVSTLALPDLVACVEGLPEAIVARASGLEAAAITVVRLAIERSGAGLPVPWTYFPDPDIPFFRLTRLERISSDLAPEGASACLLEIAGVAAISDEQLIAVCRELGVAGRGVVECAGRLHIPHAYVRFLHGHRDAAAAVIEHLAGVGIHVAGRYGAWRYANIDQTIDSGRAAAARITRPGPRHA